MTSELYQDSLGLTCAPISRAGRFCWQAPRTLRHTLTHTSTTTAESVWLPWKEAAIRRKWHKRPEIPESEFDRSFRVWLPFTVSAQRFSQSVCVCREVAMIPTWLAAVEEQVTVKVSFGLLPGHQQFAGAQLFESKPPGRCNCKRDITTRWHKATQQT